MKQITRQAINKRLNRIEGQVRGISRMVDEDRYCIDILSQVQAVRAALQKVEEEILKDHLCHCVSSVMKSGDLQEQNQKVEELVSVLGKLRS